MQAGQGSRLAQRAEGCEGERLSFLYEIVKVTTSFDEDVHCKTSGMERAGMRMRGEGESGTRARCL